MMYTFLVSFSCSFIDFSRLEVHCSLPENGGYFNEAELEVIFSLEVEALSLQEIIVLQRNGSTVATELRKTGASVFIKPTEPWQKGASYSLGIQGDAALVAGGSHQVRLYRRFTYGPQTGAFSLVDWKQPTENEPSLEFQFTFPVDVPSFSKNFSLTPSISYSYQLEDEGRRVKIIPAEEWKYNQRYSWSIQGLESQEGFLLDKKYEGDFLGQIDTELPVLEKICAVHLLGGNEYFPKEGDGITLCDKEPLLFQFSKDMDFDSVNSGLRFEPSCAGQLRRGNNNREFLWVPEENWSLEEEYRVVVSAEVQDLSGISLGKQQEAYFTVDNDFLQVLSVSLGDGGTEIKDFQSPETLQINLQDAVPVSVQSQDSTIMTKITFSKDFDPEGLVQALDSISMEVFFPLTASYPVLEKVRVSGASSLEL
ncbi:MAG: hypothetical protein J6R67_08195 [Treponema sp.]|nr:hypothetical protein [Treponema sp.]